ncbi:MAG: histidine phosphatase family protein [Pseudomonadota bacterium]|nr:histidine phosphatase family protein [Burkholderiaceae bacterium]MDQ3445292.1 histidine phosphatase family protein [Pseudomonadota bacterium]
MIKREGNWLASAFCSVVLALLSLPSPALADEALWSLLNKGGQVVLMRHAVTTPGVGDPPGFRLDDCGTQRNLTDEGRRDARRVGAAFRARGIVIENVYSSPWCRCVETANLAFGKSEISTALGNLFTHPENRERQVREMRELISVRTPQNRVLVSHGATILALTSVSLGTAEMLVVTPQSDGRFVVNGRFSAHAP